MSPTRSRPTRRLARPVRAGAALALLLLLPAAPALAEAELHLYGTFDQVVPALERLALVVSDTGFKAVFYVALTLGIVFGGYVAFLSSMSGRGASLLGWIVPPLAGAVAYLGFVVPKDTLHVYDDTRNTYQAVGNLPGGLVGIAHMLNGIETLVVEAVDTGTADPKSYKLNAGGISFALLRAAVERNLQLDEFDLAESLRHYVRDCLPLALVSDSYEVTRQTLARGSADPYNDVLAKLGNPSVWTLSYVRSKAGEAVSCTDAWRRMTGGRYLDNPDTYSGAIRGLCARAGIDPNDPPQFARCKEIISLGCEQLTGRACDAPGFIRSLYLNQRILDALAEGNEDLAARRLANRQAMIQAAGVSMAAGEWILAMRGTLFALSLGAIPFALLFIVTPLAKKAGLVVFGLLFFNTAWGVMDAVAARGAIDAAWLAFEDVRRANLGLDAILLMPEHSLRAAATFGSARTWAVSFAGLLTMALTGFGGYALSSMASHAQGKVEASGSAAAEKVGTPEGRVALEKSMQDSVGAEMRLNAVGGVGSAAHGLTSALSRHGDVAKMRALSAAGAAQGLTPTETQEMAGAVGAGKVAGDFAGLRELNRLLGRPDTAANVADTAGEVEKWGRMMDGGNRQGAWRMAESLTPPGGDAAATLARLAAMKGLAESGDNAAMGEIFQATQGMINQANRAQGRPEASLPEAAAAVMAIARAQTGADAAAFKGDAKAAGEFFQAQRNMSVAEQRGYLAMLDKMDVSMPRAKEAAGAMRAAVEAGNAEMLRRGNFTPQEILAGATLQASEMGAKGSAAMALMKGDLAKSLEDIARTHGAAAMGAVASAHAAAAASGIPADQIAMWRDAAGGVNVAMPLNGEQFWGYPMKETLTGMGWSGAQQVAGANALKAGGGGGVLNMRFGIGGDGVSASLNVGGKVQVEQGTTVSGAPGVTKFDQASFEGAMAQARNGDIGPLQGMLEGTHGNQAARNMVLAEATRWISTFGETSAGDSDMNNTSFSLSTNAGKLINRFPLLGALAEKAGVVGKGGLIDAGVDQKWSNIDEDKTTLKLSRAHIERIHEAAAEHAAARGPQGSAAYSDAYARSFHENLQASYDYLRGQAKETSETEGRLPEPQDGGPGEGDGEPRTTRRGKR